MLGRNNIHACDIVVGVLDLRALDIAIEINVLAGVIFHHHLH